VEYGSPISYLALEPGADVVSSDGKRVGAVQEVVADSGSDIFEGLVIDTRMGPGGLHYVSYDQVAEIYEHAVVLKIPAADADRLPKPAPRRR